MDAHGGVERRWSDLPVDLISEIYLRIASAYDRARFATVCRPWRGVVSWHRPLPALPLLLTSTGDGNPDQEARGYSPEDGKDLRLPLPWFPWDNRLVGSYEGGWIAMTSGSEQLHIVNFFSGVRRALRTYNISIQKLVFSDDPSSSCCIIAGLTTMSHANAIALRRVGCPVGNFEWKTRGHGFSDITFCNGKLYGITDSGLLFNFDVRVNRAGALTAISIRRVDTTATSAFYLWRVSPVRIKYIFELRGKLAIAEEVTRGYKSSGNSYRVFELVNNDTMTAPKYTWAEVTSLGDCALFLGPACSKAVNLPMAGRRGGVDVNHIYYFEKHYCLHGEIKCLTKMDMGSWIVHSSESQRMHDLARIASRGYYYHNHQVSGGGCNSCIWVWPPEF